MPSTRELHIPAKPVKRALLLFATAFLSAGGLRAAEFVLRAVPLDSGAPEVSTVVTFTDVGGDGGERQSITAPIGRSFSVSLHSGVWHVHTAAPGYFAVDSVVRIGQDVDSVTLQLWRTATISGKLAVGKDATIPASLTARWSASDPGASAEPAPDGSSSCTVKENTFSCDVPLGEMNLRLRAPTYITHFRWKVRIHAPRVDMGTLSLIHGASIVGRVLASGRTGSPAGVTRVFIRPVTYDGTQKAEALLATAARPDNGFFEFNGVSAGDYLIGAIRGRLRSREWPVSVRASGESEMNSALVLEPPRKLRIAINPSRDQEGKTWKVSLSTFRAEHWLDSARQSFAEHDGVSTWDDLLPARYMLSIGSHLRGTVLSKEIDLQDGPADLSVSIPSTSIKGTVRLGEKPISGVLTLGGRNASVSVPIDVAEDGTFSGVVPFDPKLEWQVAFDSISPPIQATQSLRPMEMTEEEAWRLDVVLDGWGIDGNIVDAEGNPVAKAIVNISPADGQNPIMQVHPAADGSFSIAGLATGTYSVEAKTFHRESSDPVSVHVGNDDAAQPVRLVVTRDDEIKGHIVSAMGPIGGAQVFAFSTDKSWIVSVPAMSAPDGSFQVPVPSGTQEVDFLVAPQGFPLKMVHLLVRHEPLTVSVESNAGSLELDVPELRDSIDTPQGVLAHRGAVRPVISFLGTRETVVSRGAVAGTTHLSVPMMEPGDYSLCAVPLQNFGALHAVLPPKDCVFGTLAPYGSLHLSAPPPGR